MKIKPLADKVLIKINEVFETSTPSGIIIPDTAQEKTFKGEVIAIGKGKVLDNGKISSMSVQVGDLVAYTKYTGTEIKWNGTDYLIMPESDIAAILL